MPTAVDHGARVRAGILTKQAPEARQAKARRARAAQQTPEYYVRRLEQMVDQGVAAAPPFSNEVVDKLRRIVQAADRPTATEARAAA